MKKKKTSLILDNKLNGTDILCTPKKFCALSNTKQSRTCSFSHIGYVFIIHKALDVEGNVRRVAAHRFLEFLTLLCQSQQSLSLGLYTHLVPGLKSSTEIFHQPLIKVFPSQIRIKGGRQHHQRTEHALMSVKMQSW